MWYHLQVISYAGVMELVDMRDLGSRASGVGVRVPTPAPIKDGVNDRFTPSFIYAMRKGLERSNRDMPVAYCCNQFKNWLLP